jgi:hypothetical protein
LNVRAHLLDDGAEGSMDAIPLIVSRVRGLPRIRARVRA